MLPLSWIDLSHGSPVHPFHPHEILAKYKLPEEWLTLTLGFSQGRDVKGGKGESKHLSVLVCVIYEGVKVKNLGKELGTRIIIFILGCCVVSSFLLLFQFLRCYFVLGLLWDSKNMLLGLRKAFLIRHKHTHTKALTFTCVVVPGRHYYFKRNRIDCFFSLNHFLLYHLLPGSLLFFSIIYSYFVYTFDFFFMLCIFYYEYLSLVLLSVVKWNWLMKLKASKFDVD